MSEQAAFDGVAASYDAEFSDTAVGRMQRERVHAYLKANLKPNLKVLELNCGTGVDARWLAEQGHSVVATDLSGEMIRVAQSRKEAGLDLEFRQAGILEALGWETGGYDLIFSDFGGFNCLSPEELRQAGELLGRALKPGGRFIGVVMPRVCVWESLYFGYKLKPREAFRRLRKGPVMAPLGAGREQATWYYGPRHLRRAFAPQLKVQVRRPIGFFLPPSYLDPYFVRRPRSLARLQRWERKVGEWGWLAGWSDHYLMEFVAG